MDRVVVLGGTSGIGQAIADAVEAWRWDSARPIAYGIGNCDVTKPGEIRRVLREEQPTHLVYSVGQNILDWIPDISRADFSRLMQVNVWGFVECIQELQLLRTGPKSVLAISSDAARRPMRTSLAYCASKAALDMAIRVASRELAPESWRVNGIAPGKVSDTGMTDYVDERVRQLRGWTREEADGKEIESTPIRRTVRPDEVADLALSVLFGPQSLTGQIIEINGGR